MTKLPVLLAAVLTLGCRDSADRAPSATAPRPSTALVGTWLRIAPALLRGETLSLRADSTANGVILWDEKRDARASFWLTRFGSRDSVASRADWRQGFTDGGDAECVMGTRAEGCVSMPMICLGTRSAHACRTFALVARDSLFLSDGSRFVRLALPPRAVDSP